jgi:hypothetical protein
MNGLSWLVILLSPLLLVSPLVFLITEVRRRPALRVAAGTIVTGSYFLLLAAAGPFFISMLIMSLAGMSHPINDSVINQDQTFAGILFPKGSTVSTINGGMLSAGKLQFIILSKETEIGRIPAGKGTSVQFSLDDGRVVSVKTGREWIYQGISVPAGSTVSLNAQFSAQAPHATSGISQILIEQPRTVVTQVEDMLVYGNAVLRFDGDKFTALNGRYEWNGEYYKSYRVGGDDQIQRIREDGPIQRMRK